MKKWTERAAKIYVISQIIGYSLAALFILFLMALSCQGKS